MTSPVDLVGGACVEVVPLRQRLALALHLSQQLAVVSRFDLTEPVCVLGDELTKAAQQLASLTAGRLWPLAAVERASGSTHGAVDVVR